MAAHARLSPSSASRWLACPYSVNQCGGILDETTEWSAEGTVAHRVSDQCLRFGLDPEGYVGMKMREGDFEFEITADWPRHLRPGMERVLDFGGRFFGERKVKLDRWMPGQFGTLDRGVVTKKLIVISDLKWGEGVPVSPVENEQLMIYALGFWDEIARHYTEATDFLLIVDQPRAEGGGGEWRTTLDDLLEFGRKIKRVAKRTYDPDAPLVPGLKQCKFCPAAKTARCPAYEKFNMDLMGLKMRDLDVGGLVGEAPALPRPTEMTPERRSYLIQHAPMIRKWLDALQADALADALAGRPVPGLKAGAGRAGARFWKNEKRASEVLREILGVARFTKTLKSPAQVEKEIPSRDFARLKKIIGQSEGKPILVPADDARPALPTTASKFRNLDE